jgi:hypothetical protein
MVWTFGEPGSYVAWSNEIVPYGTKWRERIAPSGWVLPGMPNYIGFTNYEEAVFQLWVGWQGAVSELTARANKITDYVMFYNNGEVTSYHHDGVLPP